MRTAAGQQQFAEEQEFKPSTWKMKFNLAFSLRRPLFSKIKTRSWPTDVVYWEPRWFLILLSGSIGSCRRFRRILVLLFLGSNSSGFWWWFLVPLVGSKQGLWCWLITTVWWVLLGWFWLFFRVVEGPDVEFTMVVPRAFSGGSVVFTRSGSGWF